MRPRIRSMYHPSWERLAQATERRQRRFARETFLVLNALDGRALRDLGFDRSEIASVACELAGLAEPTRARPERFTRGR